MSLRRRPPFSGKRYNINVNQERLPQGGEIRCNMIFQTDITDKKETAQQGGKTARHPKNPATNTKIIKRRKKL